MSAESYNHWWILTKEQLKNLKDVDDLIITTTKPIKDRVRAAYVVSKLYVKYTLILKNLAKCLYQLAQVQKNQTIRKLMDAAASRLTELKRFLTEIELSEFRYSDGALIEMKLIPHDVEILDVAYCFPRPLEIEDLLEQNLNGGASEQAEVATDDLSKEKMKSAMVALIQTHERARQSRLYVQDRLSLKKLSAEKAKAGNVESEDLEKAAVGFQKLFRGHAVRNYMKRRELERRHLIGMVEPSWRSSAEFDKVRLNEERRREVVKQHVREYFEANVGEKDRVVRVVGPGLMEDIGDEIREWFYQWYLRAKNFDNYPDEEVGGTVLVVRGETFTPEEWIDDVEKKRRERAKMRGGRAAADKAKAKAEAKKKEAEKKRKEAEKKKREAEARKRQASKREDFAFKFGESDALRDMSDGFNEYHKLWSELVFDEEEKLIMEPITEEKCCELQLEVRKDVDVLMRLELEMLNDALQMDRGKKPKKKKKKKKKRKKRDKKKKDLTGDRTVLDLFQELHENGIIRTYPKTYLSEFHGDYSYANWDKRVLEFDPFPTLGDVRQVVSMNCIVPLGAQSMIKPKSVLITGPRGSGKHLLANAIFTETQCVLFDISPEKVAGKYKGKKDMKLFIHLLNKVSRLLQPSVIFIDGAEKPFYKKVPRDQRKFEPKKMGKQLFKGIVKTITPEDRVLVLGISSQPWAAKKRGLMKAFQTVIMIPRTDYGSVYLYWRELLMPYHGVDRNIDLSTLAKLTVKVPLCELKKIVETVLTPRRIAQLSYNPLQQSELYSYLVVNPALPVSDKEYAKFEKWFRKTPLAKRKARYMVEAEKRREQEAKRAAKEAEKAAKAAKAARAR